MKRNELAVVPAAKQFVASPLRNSIKLELDATIEQVWAMVGDPERMPEYSAALETVTVERDPVGRCNAYVCYFRPTEEAPEGIIHNVRMVWYEPNVGWASQDEEPNAFGLQDSLTLITLEQMGTKTILSWDMHFNSDSHEVTQANLSGLEQTLNCDIAQNLVKRFKGIVLDDFVEGKRW